MLLILAILTIASHTRYKGGEQVSRIGVSWTSFTGTTCHQKHGQHGGGLDRLPGRCRKSEKRSVRGGMSWGLSLSIASTHDRLFMLKTPHAHFIEMHRYFIEIKTIISVKSCLVSLKWILSSSCIRHDIKIPPLGGDL